MLINQNGKRISLHQFRGSTLLLTSHLYALPFPDFCPRESHEFAAIDRQFRAEPARYGKTHLLSISFDPAHDTLKVLRGYGFSCAGSGDPAPLFPMGVCRDSPAELPQVADYFGLIYKEEGGLITHSLSTAVISPDGRIFKWYHGAEWQASDLLQDAASCRAPCKLIETNGAHMRYVFVVLTILGIAVSALALREHYREGDSPCSINDHWDCGIVNHSPYAMLGPIPVAVLGMLGYILMGVSPGGAPGGCSWPRHFLGWASLFTSRTSKPAFSACGASTASSRSEISRLSPCWRWRPRLARFANRWSLLTLDPVFAFVCGTEGVDALSRSALPAVSATQRTLRAAQRNTLHPTAAPTTIVTSHNSTAGR